MVQVREMHEPIRAVFLSLPGADPAPGELSRRIPRAVRGPHDVAVDPPSGRRESHGVQPQQSAQIHGHFTSWIGWIPGQECEGGIPVSVEAGAGHVRPREAYAAPAAQHPGSEIVSPAPDLDFAQARALADVVILPPLPFRPETLVDRLLHRFLKTRLVPNVVDDVPPVLGRQRHPLLFGDPPRPEALAVGDQDADRLHHPSRPVRTRTRLSESRILFRVECEGPLLSIGRNGAAHQTEVDVFVVVVQELLLGRRQDPELAERIAPLLVHEAQNDLFDHHGATQVDLHPPVIAGVGQVRLPEGGRIPVEDIRGIVRVGSRPADPRPDGVIVGRDLHFVLCRESARASRPRIDVSERQSHLRIRRRTAHRGIGDTVDLAAQDDVGLVPGKAPEVRIQVFAYFFHIQLQASVPGKSR